MLKQIPQKQHGFSLPACYFLFFFIFKLYIIVLVLPNIKMNPPQVYMCSPSWTLLPPPSPFHPSGSSQCTTTFSFYLKTSMLFFQFKFPPTVHESSLFSTSSSKLVISCLFDNRHRDRCEVMSQCGFNLHYPDISDIEHLFLAISVSSLEQCLFRSFTYFPIRYMICKYFLPFRT